MKLVVFRDKTDIEFKIRLELNGGSSSVSEITTTCGSKYDFPIVTKTNYILENWYSDPSFTNKITKDDKVDYNIRTIYAKWIEMTNYTSFEVTTTSSYKEFGFYSATKKSTSPKIYIDWGDGQTESLDSISQKYHTYSTIGTFIVKVSDDITSLTVSKNSSTYYGKIRYTLKKVLAWSTSITTLPNYCFYYASALTTISANLNHITSLGSYCFYYCNTLSSFEFIRGMTKLTSIPTRCFQSCTYFNNLDVIQTSVKSFGAHAFQYCKITDLSRIRSTDTLESYCFAYNTTLTSLTTLKPRTSFPSYLFYNCSGLKQADLSQFTSLTSLNMNCFYECSQLTSVSLPNSIKAISDYSFAYCSQLKNTDFLSNKTQLTSIGNYSFGNCTALSSINLPNTIKSIGNYAFYYNYASGLKDLSLSGLTQLTSIGTSAFNYCYNLTAISLPSSLTSIGDGAFAGCYNVSQISSYRDTAPTVAANTFGSSTTNGSSAYTGNNKRASNTSRLYVNVPANYKTSYWKNVLLDSTKSNFKVVSFDPYSASGFDISGVESRYVYSGEAITPVVTVKNSNGETLTLDTDYTVAYSNNIELGTATITITGIGTYYDSQTINFKIYDPTAQTLTVDLNSQWRTPQQWTNTNPDFDVYESYSNYNVNSGYAKMFIKVNGYTALTIYINSYAESYYDYTLAFVPDYNPTSLPSGSSVSGNIKGTTYGYQYNPSSYGITSGSGWKKVDYTLDGGEHTICICYRKDSSYNQSWDRGYVAIPKN